MTVFRQRNILRMIDNHLVEHGRVLQSAAHKCRIFYVVTVIGERNDARFRHITEFRQFLTFKIFGNGADKFNLHDTCQFRLFFQTSHEGRIIYNRCCIRHRYDPGKAAGCRRLCTGMKIFLRFLTGFA